MTYRLQRRAYFYMAYRSLISPKVLTTCEDKHRIVICDKCFKRAPPKTKTYKNITGS